MFFFIIFKFHPIFYGFIKIPPKKIQALYLKSRIKYILTNFYFKFFLIPIHIKVFGFMCIYFFYFFIPDIFYCGGGDWITKIENQSLRDLGEVSSNKYLIYHELGIDERLIKAGGNTGYGVMLIGSTACGGLVVYSVKNF
jgi:hypothetical protein